MVLKKDIRRIKNKFKIHGRYHWRQYCICWGAYLLHMRNVFVLDIQEESEIWILYCICDKNYASATPHTGSAAYMVLYQVVESMYWSKKFIKAHSEYHRVLLLSTCMQILSLWTMTKVLVSALVTLVSIMFPLILKRQSYNSMLLEVVWHLSW